MDEKSVFDKCKIWGSVFIQAGGVDKRVRLLLIFPFGAARLRDGKLVCMRETTRFNAETCFDFLQHLWKVSSRSGRRVNVMTDNSHYHHAALHKEWWKAAEPRFRLEYRPSISPNLNPIERV